MSSNFSPGCESESTAVATPFLSISSSVRTGVQPRTPPDASPTPAASRFWM